MQIIICIRCISNRTETIPTTAYQFRPQNSKISYIRHTIREVRESMDYHDFNTKEKDMDITRYRFTSALVMHDSMEAEVKDGEHTYYVNIDVNRTGEPAEILDDGWGSYSKPLDEVDYNTDKDAVTDVDFSEILRQLTEKWNASPIFPQTDRSWHAWEQSHRNRLM